MNCRGFNGCGDYGLSGFENDAGNVCSSGPHRPLRHGIHRHQCDGYCACQRHGDDLQMGGTVGAKQTIGHFSLVLCVYGYPKDGWPTGSPTENSKFSTLPKATTFRITSAMWYKEHNPGYWAPWQQTSDRHSRGACDVQAVTAVR